MNECMNRQVGEAVQPRQGLAKCFEGHVKEEEELVARYTTLSHVNIFFGIYLNWRYSLILQ